MDQRHQQIIIGVFETNVDDYMLSQKLDQPKVQNFVGIRHRGNHEEVFHIKTLRIFGAKCDINVKTVEHLEDTSYRIYIEGIYPMPGDVLSSTSEQTTHQSLFEVFNFVGNVVQGMFVRGKEGFSSNEVQRWRRNVNESSEIFKNVTIRRQEFSHRGEIVLYLQDTFNGEVGDYLVEGNFSSDELSKVLSVWSDT